MSQHFTTAISDGHLLPPPSSPLFSTITYPHLSYHGNGKVQEAEQESMVTMEMSQALLYATLELEASRAAAQEELAKMEAHAAHLKALLEAATRERDELRQQCHHARLLLLHTSRHHQHHQIPPPNTTTQAHAPSQPPNENGTADVSASSEESSIASSFKEKESEFEIGWLVAKRELPEKGRLLEAVTKAGPLLQNLLLAGPLPQWRHPPPPLHIFEIPPVPLGTISTSTPELNNDEVNNSTSHRF